MIARPRPDRRAGFTLAELAVTLAIVAIIVIFVLQGILSARDDAFKTHNLKVARDLALLTLGRVESGQYQEDLRGSYYGPFVYEENELFEWELALGGEPLRERVDDGSFDSWYQEPDEDEDEDAEEPYEQVEIKVSWTLNGNPDEGASELFMVRYIPWVQVYGEEESDEDEGRE